MAGKDGKAEKLANNVLDFVNAYGHDDKAFAETICRSHRTLQQSVMRLFITTIRQMAVMPCDERNEAAKALAREISRIAEDHPLPLI